MPEPSTTIHPGSSAGSTTRPRLTLADVTKSFSGRTVVDVDDLSFGDHPIEGLIGPNGAGKTTLMRLITGSLRGDSGQIRLERQGERGLELSRLPAHKVARSGVIKTNQVITDFESLTILDSLLLAVTPEGREFPLCLTGERKTYEEHRVEIERHLDHFGLDNSRRLALSAGEKKLVDIIRCLLLKPSVLLLDEPTAGLPGEVTHKVMDAVGNLAADGTTVIIIEHDLDVIWNLCSQVTFMAEGRVMLRGEPAVIREHETVVESYLGQGHV
ncbi:MAG: ATP-binding cassette domain-containing protein [Nocardioides sp.]